MASILKSRSTAAAGANLDRATNTTTGLAGFNLSDLADVGRRQLDESRSTAAKIIQDAQQQAELICKRAHDEGYQLGLQKASQDNDAKIKSAAEERAQEQLALIRLAVEKLHVSHEAWMSEYAESLTSIALLAAERIVRGKLEAEKTILVCWVKDAIQSTRAASKLTVAVNPEMLAELGAALDDLVASPEYPFNTQVVPDESLDMTAVVVRQDGGEIRAGLVEQLQRLSEMLG